MSACEGLYWLAGCGGNSSPACWPYGSRQGEEEEEEEEEEREEGGKEREEKWEAAPEYIIESFTATSSRSRN